MREAEVSGPTLAGYKNRQRRKYNAFDDPQKFSGLVSHHERRRVFGFRLVYKKASQMKRLNFFIKINLFKLEC